MVPLQLTVPLLRAIVRLLQQGISLPHATFAHTLGVCLLRLLRFT
jgi:hypothetical protein